MKSPQFSTLRLSIHPLFECDSKVMLDYATRNHDFLAPFTPTPAPNYLTQAHWESQISQAAQEWGADKALRFVLFPKENLQHAIGTANITQIFRGAFQAAYLGFGIDQAHQGRGLMFEALTDILKYAFKDANLHRIMANHLTTNKRSATLLKRLGFQEEGIARRYLMINGHWQDHVLTSLTNDLWTSH